MDSHCVTARFMDETCALRVFVVNFSLHTDRWERLRVAPVGEVPSGSASHREDAKSAKGRGDLAGAGHVPLRRSTAYQASAQPPGLPFTRRPRSPRLVCEKIKS